MNNLFKTILIILIAIFGAGILFVDSAQAQSTDSLVVEFETTPLFSEANFLPGGGITRWVKVTNNSGSSQRIVTEAINYPNPIPAGDLSRALMFVIKEGTTDLYGGSSPTGPKLLYDFYQDSSSYSEISLSDLASGATTQYDFIISFPTEKENEWQNATTTFDILIGFQGTEGGILPGTGSSGGGSDGGSSTGSGSSSGGGGWLPPGLTIQNEAMATTTETSVTFIWTTSYPASSQVIYAEEGENHILDLTDNAGIPPKYGYARTSPEYNIIPKVTSHSVTIGGLTPGTRYYYRTISHASLAIGEEHSFTTLNFINGAPSISVAMTAPVSIPAASKTSTASGPTKISAALEQPIIEPPTAPQPIASQSLLASVDSVVTLGTNSVIVNILVTVIILALIGYTTYAVIQRARRKNLGKL